VLEQSGLLNGMATRRLIIAFDRRPEGTEAADGGVSGRPLNIEDGTPERILTSPLL
jgi:hypothetical protein